jgi:hypothetical protein
MMVIASVEGVLAEPGFLVPMAAPNIWGRVLYDGMQETSFVLLTESRSGSLARQWLLTNHFNRWVQLSTMEGEPLGTSPLEWKRRCLEGVLAASHRPSFYVDADPDAVRQASALGIPGLLLAVPGKFPEPQHSYQPWDELVTTIEDNILRRAEAQADMQQEQVVDDGS